MDSDISIALICLVICCFVILSCSIVTGGGTFIYKKLNPPAEEKQVESDNSNEVNAYLQRREEDAAALVKPTITVKRIRHPTATKQCLQATPSSGGAPGLADCNDDASSKYQKWQYNANGTVSNPDGTMCFTSDFTRQKPAIVNKDPNNRNYETIPDDINGKSVIVKQCDGGVSTKWTRTGNSFRQDNGVGREVCWVLLDSSKNDSSEKGASLKTWYCSERTPAQLEPYDFTGKDLSF